MAVISIQDITVNATGNAIASTTLTGWTTSVAAGDIFGFNLDATSGPKYITVDVRCQ